MLRRLVWLLFGGVLPYVLALADPHPSIDFGVIVNALQSANVTRQQPTETPCDRELLALVAGVQAKEFWAVKLLDSWGKWPAGIFAGNLYELGHYDECIDLRHDYGGSPAMDTLRGRYCFLTVPLAGLLPSKRPTPPTQRIMPGTSGGPLAAHLGVCIPAACSAEQFQQFLTRIVPNLPPVQLTCNEIAPALGPAQWVAIGVFGTVLLLAAASTLYEAVTLCRRRTPHPNLAMFSLYRNGRKLLATSRRNPTDTTVKSSTIDCIHGIRVISMVWVVFSHNYVRIGMQPLYNSHVILSWLESYHSVLVVASTVSVDTFFLLSGLLTCWSILNALDRHGRLNLPVMYLHRYLRLTPALAAIVLFAATLMRHAGSGPFWDGAMSMSEDPCRRYWWSALLYVQNYVNPQEVCLGHTWYLSVDMQLYLVSPFIVYPLWRWGRRVLAAIVALTVASMVAVLVLFFVHHLRLSFLAVDEERLRHVYTYYPTHTRAGAWLVGVCFGYVLQRTRKHYVPLPRWSVGLGWALAATAMLAVLFADHPIQQPDYERLPQAVDAIYESLSRVCWATAVGWVVFACVNGYGGPVDRLLGATVWQPLGRLSYAIYLLHLPIQLMMAGTARLPYYFTDLLAVYQFWGDIGFTLTLALLWTLLFESPIIGLERMLFGRRRDPSKRTPQEKGPASVENGNEARVIPKSLSLTLQTARL
ncbi:nose resistant to fluoxetine protein 6-like [Anopheles arabiensis]|uniref:Nose resistant-to-fluoxetine protein N-terminal domain-containing protein n=1 Tax=Anopheles arabiensis TaxID=7173 RepID=A0A182IAA6_ANOAR|nr:nose resistant to fluoxetine protein 6-like [Anopheles arabiensis]